MTMPMRTACPATHSHNSSYDGACAVSVWYLCTVTRESRGIPRTTHSPGTQPSVKGPVCKCGLCSSSSTTSTAVLRTVAVCSVTRAKLPFAKMVYSCSAGSCANARASARWPIAPWSMHRARHQRVAFARPSAHASQHHRHTQRARVDFEELAQDARDQVVRQLRRPLDATKVDARGLHRRRRRYLH